MTDILGLIRRLAAAEVQFGRGKDREALAELEALLEERDGRGGGTAE